MRRRSAIAIAIVALVACQRHDDKGARKTGSGSGSGSGSAIVKPANPHVEQVPPPADLKQPPIDAVKTSSGLVYKKLVENASGASPSRNDSVLVHLTGWRQSNGETFNTTAHGKATLMNLATASPGFSEGLQAMKKGETILLWIPPSLGYVRAPSSGTPETLVYSIELVDVIAAPPIPPDVAAPPATAKLLPSGIKMIVVHPGTGAKDKPRAFDTATFHFTGWEADGRMVQTTESAKRPQTSPLYKQSVAFEQVMETMTVGERVRLWATADQLGTNGKALGSPPGTLCFELELVSIAKGTPPPAVPADLAAPPATATLTPKHVAYVVLAKGPAANTTHPLPSDRVRVHYTGWRAQDGRMFESTVVRDEPAEVAVNAPPVSGWTEVLPLLVVGERVRIWVPEELAYKGAPGRPQGPLVFELELLEIKPQAAKPVKTP